MGERGGGGGTWRARGAGEKYLECASVAHHGLDGVRRVGARKGLYSGLAPGDHWHCRYRNCAICVNVDEFPGCGLRLLRLWPPPRTNDLRSHRLMVAPWPLSQISENSVSCFHRKEKAYSAFPSPLLRKAGHKAESKSSSPYQPRGLKNFFLTKKCKLY
jgi:hypothetical protein